METTVCIKPVNRRYIEMQSFRNRNTGLPVLNVNTGKPILFPKTDSIKSMLQRMANDRIELHSALLTNVDLNGASLSWAKLRGSNLRNAKLIEACLYKADLSRVTLDGALLRNANLYGADLCHSMLRSADLAGANLRYATLFGSDLRGAKLEDVDLRGAIIDWKWPRCPIEILLQCRNKTAEQVEVINRITANQAGRPFAWLNILNDFDPELSDWALYELSKYSMVGDNAPPLIREAAAAN